MAVVTGVPVGGLSVAALVGGPQVVVVVLMSFQLPDDALAGHAIAGHVVDATLHIAFQGAETVLGVEDRHVTGAVRDADGSVCLSWFFRFLRLALHATFRGKFTGNLVGRYRNWQCAEHQHHCQ